MNLMEEVMADVFNRRGFIGITSAVAMTLGRPLQVLAEALPAPARKVRDIHLKGQVFAYCADAGETPLILQDGDVGGTLFTVSFVRQDVDQRQRPVAFVWNGGPGGASWPLREQLAPRTFTSSDDPAGFRYIDNPDSPFDAADLVFIDAPGTGFSRVFSEAGKQAFWGVAGDADVFADFIAGWLERNVRQTSPVYLLGESYGGTRAVEVAARLAAKPAGSVRLAGLLLVSPALSGGGEMLDEALQAAMQLPTEAATAHFHGKGADTDLSLETLAAKAEAFAAGPLRSPPAMDTPAFAKMMRDVAGYTGLPEAYVAEIGPAVPAKAFRSHLLLKEGLDLTTYDGRKTYPRPTPGEQPSVINQRPGYDLHAAIVGSIVDDLGYATNAPYNRDPVGINNYWQSDDATDACVLPKLERLTRDGHLPVVCLPKSGPVFELAPASDMELRHGQESQA
jgi:carboxypeptidase C (cathepsin A)